jgi:hypothetical protein
MAHGRTSLLQGTLDLLILKALTIGELHGLGVSRRIVEAVREQSTREILPLDEGGTTTTGRRSQSLEPHCGGDRSCTRNLTGLANDVVALGSLAEHGPSRSDRG